LHYEFEWDDTEAATQYRLTQARNPIRSVVRPPRTAGRRMKPDPRYLPARRWR
jgi:hypothetical protein